MSSTDWMGPGKEGEQAPNEQDRVDTPEMDEDGLRRWQQLMQLIRKSEGMDFVSLISPNPHYSRIWRSEGLDLLPVNDAVPLPLLCERNGPCD